MHKTSVYLTAADLARLANLAQREGISQAEVIRRAINRYEADRSGDRSFELVGSGEGPGRSVADTADEDLLDGFGT